MLPLPEERRGMASVVQECPFYHFSTSFSDVKLKPGSIRAHLIFDFHEGVLVCVCV